MKSKIFFYNVIVFIFILASSCKKNTTPPPNEIPLKKQFESASVINTKLGHGTNYSGMFETATGMNWVPNYARTVANAGFKHVRIATKWERDDRSMPTPPYTINGSFMGTIKQAVDSAIRNGLYVIIDMQNHWALMDDPDGQKDRFLAQWKQISTAFKDYPDSLLFEILNEPGKKMTPEKWNVFFAAALSTIREDNPDRTVLIDLGVDGLADLPFIELPDDEHIILTPHYYRPFDLTHQGLDWSDPNSVNWVGTEWWDTEPEREVIRREFAPLKDFEEQHHIPIHIGEFGIDNVANVASRKKWATFTTRYFDQMGWSWAFFNFSIGSFGNVDPTSPSFNEYLLNAVLHDKIPDPTPYTGLSLYSSNFQSGKDGWVLNLSGGGSGNLTSSGNALNVSISNGGTLNWHVQLSKPNIALQKGKKYHLSFKAKSNALHNIDAFFTMTSPPYTYYYTTLPLEVTLAPGDFKQYDFVIDMHGTTDNSARLGIDVGGPNISGANLSFTDIKIEQMIK